MASRLLVDEHPQMFRANPVGFIVLALVVIGGLASMLVWPIWFGLAMIVLGVLGYLMWWVKTLGERVAVTQNEVLVERGILNKDRTEIGIAGIRTINVKQSFLDRILGVGQIQIYTAGDLPEARIAGIFAPNRIREIVRTRQSEIKENG